MKQLSLDPTPPRLQVFVACLLSFAILITPIAAVAAPSIAQVTPAKTTKKTEQTDKAKSAAEDLFVKPPTETSAALPGPKAEPAPEPLAPPLPGPVTATMTAALANDDGDTKIDPTNNVVGTTERIDYTVTLSNTGTDPTGLMSFNDFMDARTTFVAGSITSTPVCFDQTGANAVSTNEDVAKAITLTGEDPDGDGITYEIVTGPSHGTLNPGVAGSSQTYNPTLDYNGPDSFTFKVKDATQYSNQNCTVSIDVVAVNDAPTITYNGSPASGTLSTLTINEDTPKTLNGVNLFSVADVDVGSNSLKINLGVAHGKIQLATTIGITFVDGTSNNSASLHFTGNLTNLNNALNGMIYTPDQDWNSTRGSESLSFTVNDQGFTGSGGALSASATLPITVTAVNDKPVPATKSFNVQGNMKITYTINLAANGTGDVTDVDNADGGFTNSFTLTSVTGGCTSVIPAGASSTCVINNIQNGAGTATFDFEPPAGNQNALTLSYTVTDNGNGTGGNQTSNAGTINIATLTPVIWFVNPGAASNGTGTLFSPFNNLADAASKVASGTALNQRVFVYKGTAATTAGQNIALQGSTSGTLAQAQTAAHWLIGQGTVAASFDALMGITPPPGTIVRPTLGATATAANALRPVIQGQVTMKENTTVRGLNINVGAGLKGITATSLAGGVSGSALIISDVNVTSTTGAGVEISTTSGTSSVTYTTSDSANSPNILSSSSATALSVLNTTIGASGMTFQKIDAGNNTAAADPVNGIVLNNTGSSGNLVVSGNAGSCTIATPTCTGGQIQRTTGDGVLLTSTNNVSLNLMNIHHNLGNGIKGTTLNGFKLDSDLITNNGDSAAADESGADIIGLTGTASGGANPTSITNTTFNENLEFQLQITNTSGTLTDLTMSGNTIKSTGAGGTIGNLFNLLALGTANIKLSLTSGTFTGNAPNTATGVNCDHSGTSGTATCNISGATFTNNNVAITVSQAQGGNLKFTVSGNTATGNRSHGLNLFVAAIGTGTVDGSFLNNTVGTLGTPGSGSDVGFGIRVQNEGVSTTNPANVLISGNTVQEMTNFAGINVNQGIAGQTTSKSSNVTITNNTIKNVNNSRAIIVQQNNSTNGTSAGSTCADISGNHMSGIAGNVGDLTRIRFRRLDANGGVFKVRQKQATAAADALELDDANSFAGAETTTSANISVGGTPTYNQPACTQPSAMYKPENPNQLFYTASAVSPLQNESGNELVGFLDTQNNFAPAVENINRTEQSGQTLPATEGVRRSWVAAAAAIEGANSDPTNAGLLSGWFRAITGSAGQLANRIESLIVPTASAESERPEVGRRKSEIGSQRSEVGDQRSEIRNQKSDVRLNHAKGVKTEVRDQRSEIKGQRSDVRLNHAFSRFAPASGVAASLFAPVVSGGTFPINGTGAGFILPAGKSTTIKFSVTLKNPPNISGVPPATPQVSNFGTLSGTFSNNPINTNTIATNVDLFNSSTALTSSPSGASSTNEPVTFTATVSFTGAGSPAPASGSPGGTMVFKDGASVIGGCGAAPVVAGVAQCTTSALSAGPHNNITAEYSGDGSYDPSTSGAFSQTVSASNTSTVIVTSGSPSFVTQNVTFTATVTSSTSVVPPTGSVQFRDGPTLTGTALGAPVALTSGGACPANKGCASLVINTLTAGAHTITADYLPDAAFNASTGSVPQQVDKSNTATSLTSSANPSTPGQNVTFTATVTSATSVSPPTGTVDFLDGATVICDDVAKAAGQWTCQTAALTNGNHSITAVYNEDATWNTSTSNTVSQDVNQVASTTALVSSQNPSTPGQSVTFTATVSTASGVPTGDVTFYDGAILVGNIIPTCGAVGLSGGAPYQATCTTSGLSEATHNITAVYSGDTTFSGSTSNTVAQVVTSCSASVVVLNTADSGAGSLRQAITTGVCEGGTITFDPVAFAAPGPYTISLTDANGELLVGKSMTITGPGASVLTVKRATGAGNKFRVFEIAATKTVIISGMTISNGRVEGAVGTGGGVALGANGGPASGGGILNAGTLTLLNAIVSGNQAVGGVGEANATAGGAGGDAKGGGIFNSGTLTLTNTIVNGTNTATGGQGGDSAGTTGSGGNSFGGGVYTLGATTLTLNNSTIAGNAAAGGAVGVGGGAGGVAGSGSGGGIYNDGTGVAATARITNSTISGNTASLNGGGIYNTGAVNSATLTLTNSTVSGNTANNDGGGIYNSGALATATLTSVTVTTNTADNDNDAAGAGGGIKVVSGTLSLTNTIVAGNFNKSTGPTADDISGAVAGASSFNLIGIDTGMTGISNGTQDNQVGVGTPIDAKLGPIASNGGPTQTHALLVTSPAIDKGNNFLLTTLNGAIDASQANVTVFDAANIPVGLTILVDSEQMIVSSKAANILTVFRGANGTTGAIHSDGATVKPAFDQRGFKRTVNFDGLGPSGTGDDTDIGAYERQTRPLAPNLPVLDPASDTGAPGDFTTSDASPSFNISGVIPGALVELLRDTNPSTGVLQKETATVVETSPGGLATAGNAKVIVTAAEMTGSPKTVSVALLTTDNEAAVATKIGAALSADTDVSAYFTVSVSGADVILTAKTAAANDGTLNISIADDTCVGLTAAPFSADTPPPGAAGPVVVASGTAVGTTIQLTDPSVSPGNYIYTARQTVSGAPRSEQSAQRTITIDAADVTAPTASITAVAPDPRNTSVSSITIVFSEPVSGFDLADLTLKRNAGANLLTGGQTLTTSDNVTWTLGNLSGLTGTAGTYDLKLTASGSGIIDTSSNALVTDATETWVMETTAPTVSITAVAPDPRNTSVSSITIVFSEAVTGFDLADLTLKLNAGANLLTGGQTLTSGDNITWTLGNLSGLTGTEGTYVLKLTASGSGITDTAGNALVTDATETWVVDTTAPTASITAVAPDPRNTSVSSIQIVFSEAVSGFDLADLTLKLNAGANLLTGGQTLTSGDNITWTLGNLGGLTGAAGTYVLALTASGAGITDAVGNALTADATDTWVVDTTAPTVNITAVAPDPRNTSVSSITIVFSEAVSGFDLADLTLKRNAGANLLTGGQTLTSGDNITWTLGNLSGLTGTEGTYDLKLTASGSGIIDTAGNALTADATETWVTDTTLPTVAMTSAVGNPTATTPIPVTVTFSEPVTGFIATDIVTSNGGVSNFAGGPTIYTFDLTPASPGPVTADIAAGVATDAAGNTNTAATQFNRTFDPSALNATITPVTPDPRNTSVSSITIVFNKAIQPADFTLADLSLKRGAVELLPGTATLTTLDNTTWTLGGLSGMTGTAGTYTLKLTASGSGIKDTANNPLTSDATETWVVDTTVPTVTINQRTAADPPAQDDPAIGPTATTHINFIVVFSETVTGFDTTDVDISTNTAGASTVTISEITAGTKYNVSIGGMTQSGNVIATIKANAVTDSAGNANGVSSSGDNTVAYQVDNVTSFEVNTTADPGVGGCTAVGIGDGCALREAIAAANADAGAETITFDPTVFAPAGGPYTINLTGVLPDLSTDMTISGPGANVLTVKRDTGGAYRIFNIPAGSNNVTIDGLTISNGDAGGSSGGGIFNFSSGTVNVTNCTISGNSAGTGGGGIYQSTNGKLNISNSTISGNSAGIGGGLRLSGFGTVNITNSTISGNTAAVDGGGIQNEDSVLTISNSTIAFNRADSDNNATGTGGGIFRNTGTVTLKNTIVGDNLRGSATLQKETATVVGTITSAGTKTAKVTVTAAGMNFSPKTLNVNVDNGDSASTVAGKMRAALTADPDVSAFFAVSGATDQIILTVLTAAPNDATMNIATDNGTSTGLTAAPTSANTTAGATGDDIAGTVQSDGFNLIQSGAVVQNPGAGPNITGQDPQLNVLADNGGPTRTHALKCTSPATDKGTVVLTTLAGAIDNVQTSINVTTAIYIGVGSVIVIDTEQILVTGKAANTLTVTRGANSTTPATHSNGTSITPLNPTDQRGGTRPFDLADGAYPNAVGGDGTDIGAYETVSGGGCVPDAISPAPQPSTNEDVAVVITLKGTYSQNTNLVFTTTSPAHGTLGPVSASNCSFTTSMNCTATVTYTPSANYNGPDTFTFRAVTNPGGLESDPADVNITVLPVNDPPVAGNAAAITDEDTPVDLTLTASDIDSASLTFTVTQPAHGSVVIGAPSCLAGTCSVTATYTPALNFNGNDSFTFRANDGSDNSNVATGSILVNSINDAPVLDNAGNMSLTAIDEDIAAASNNGNTVAAIIASAGGDRITDGDALALEGLAVIAADNTNGAWEFSIDSGANWTPFGSPNSANARLLAATAATRVRFQPNANFNGTVNPGLTFRAWDRTTGANGGTADASVVGDATAFSVATETASITVNPIADTPSVTSAVTSVNIQTSSGLVISRNAADSTETTHFKITNITNGTLFQADGTTQINNDAFITFAQGNAGLKFTPANNLSSPTTFSFDIQASVSNLDAGLGGSIITATITVNCGSTVVTNSNDAGAGSLRAIILSACPGSTITFDMTPGNVTSPITLSSQLTIDKSLTIQGPGANLLTIAGNNTFRLINASGAGSNLSISGLSITGGGTQAGASGSAIEFSNAGTLTLADSEFFTNSGAGIGVVSVTLSTGFTINSSTFRGNTATVVVKSDRTPMTVVNSTFSGNTGTAIYNSAVGSTVTNSTVADNSTGIQSDSAVCGGCAANVTVTNTLLSNNGNFNLRRTGTATLTSGGRNLIDDATAAAFSAADPTNIIVGAGGALIGPLANNGGPTQTRALLAGSPALDAGSNAAVTNPPFSGVPPFTDQRGAGFARIVDGPDADTTDTVDIGAFEAQLSVEDITDKVTNEDTQLQFTFNVGGAASITSITATSSNTGLVPNNAANIAVSGAGSTRTLTINPAADQFGTSTITITVNGANSQTMTDTFTLTVNSVNDVPSFTKGADQTVNEDAGAQTVAGWATNLSVGPANETGQTLAFQVTGNTNPGLFSAGPAISPTGTLTYTPATNINGSATITITLKDSGGTANGGVDTSAPQIFTITVNSVNDVPSFTKGADQTVNEDAGAQTVVGWATNLSVGPANETGQTLTFQVTGNTNPGLFSAAPAISSTGTLTYTPAANANGSATITIVLKDDGGTANGGVDTSAPQTFTITVGAVNDAPVNHVPGPQTIPLNTSFVFSAGTGNAIFITDIDAGSDPVQVTLKATDGTITLNGTAGLSFSAGDGTDDQTMTFTGSIASINAALEGMKNLAFGSGVIEITTNDLGHNGIGGALTDIDTIAVTVNDNLPPSLLTIEGSDRAIALDSVTLVRDPFALLGDHNFSSDHRTRITLFVLHAQLKPGETASAITAEADDSGTIIPLTVESVRTVPGFDWLTQIVVKFPTNFATGGGGPQDVKVRITLRGAISNQAVITIVPAPPGQ